MTMQLFKQPSGLGFIINWSFDLEKVWRLMWLGVMQVYEPTVATLSSLKSWAPGVGALAIQSWTTQEETDRRGLFQNASTTSSDFLSEWCGEPVTAEPLFRYYHDRQRRSWCWYPFSIETKVQRWWSYRKLLEAIVRANQREDIDVLIIGRGGVHRGSLNL